MFNIKADITESWISRIFNLSTGKRKDFQFYTIRKGFAYKISLHAYLCNNVFALFISSPSLPGCTFGCSGSALRASATSNRASLVSLLSLLSWKVLILIKHFYIITWNFLTHGRTLSFSSQINIFCQSSSW